MLTVYKYPVPLDDAFGLNLPIGARTLTFAAQGEIGCLWALVDPHAEAETRRFRLAGTGHAINVEPERLAYVGTALFRGGALVFHLFEIIAPSEPSPSPAP